jgi:selenocysteine lyase/cysteine desulfurase
MGYVKFSPADAAQWRPQFPVTRHLVYLNHAAVAPLSVRCAQAMKDLAEDACQFGSLHYGDWLSCYDGLRRSAARLVNAEPGEIAIVKNTSEGIATIAMGMDWRPGDRVVAFAEEFPANFFPWKRLESQGVRITWLSIYDSFEKIDEACRGARLLALSYVNYLSGYRIDLEQVGAICKQHGAIFFVDAIQGLGAFPMDVRRAGIHALAADGHKWLLGPEGCGILYIQRDFQDSVDAVEFGWTNVAGYNDYASRDMTLRPDAGRYECGTLNTIGCFGLRAALDLILEVDVDCISPRVLALAQQAAHGALRKGYEILGSTNHVQPGAPAVRTAFGGPGEPPAPERGSGIVSLRKPGWQSEAIVSRLREAGILASPRQGWIRISPHFYQTEEEIARLVDLLP